jgi:hypothetical protein
MAIDPVLEVESREPALRRLVNELVPQLGEDLRDPRQWERSLVAVVEAVRQLLAAEFGGGSVTEEAATSAFRTFLRRIRDGELARDADAIERFLVQTAFTRAYRLRTRAGRRIVADPVDPHAAVDEVLAWVDGGEEQQRELNRVMGRYLSATLRRMEPYLKNARHRRVFHFLLQDAYGDLRLTHREIATQVGCSERTVERVQQTFERRWLPLVEQARSEFDDLVSRLEDPSR